MAKVRVGLIGTGFGRRVHMPGLKAVPDIEVVAVCSAQKNRAEEVAKEFNVPVATDNWREMVAMKDIDLVDVTPPPDLHKEMSIGALEAGKHVICEKPMSLNVQEAREMVKKAQQHSKLVNVIDHEQRYTPVRLYIRELVQQGYIGKLQFLLVTVNNNYGVNPSMEPYYYGWLSLKSRAGGALNGLLSHTIDMIRQWFGDFAEIAGRTKIIIPERPVLTFDYRDGDPIGPETPTRGLKRVETDDCMAFTGVMSNGALVTLVGGWSFYHAAGSRVEAYGDQGTLVLDNSNKLWGGKKGDKGLQELPVPERFNPTYRAPGLSSSFAALAQETVGAIQGTLKGKPQYATFEDGLRVQEVIDAVFASEKGAGWVKVGPTA